MFLANLATYALSHVPTAAAWIFQEADRRLGSPLPVEADGIAGENRRHHSVHHVRMVDWRDDRSRHGVQRCPQTVARFCSRRCRRPARRQNRRSHQSCRAQQEEPPGQGCHRWPAGIQGSRRFHRYSWRADRSLQARPGACRSHRSRRVEARPGRSGHHRFHGSVRRTVRHRGRHSERVQGNFQPRRPPVWARSPAVFRKRW